VPRLLKGNRAPALGLAAAVALSAFLLLRLDSQLTFIADDWELLVVREGWGPGVFLEPFNENIVVGPAVVFKLLLAVFGMDSALPFYLVSISLFLVSAVLLWLYARARVGDWLALVAAASVLFLGAAFEDLLWAFQIGYFGSMAAGLGTLLAFDREDERWDALACGLLVVSLAFSSLGLVFVAAAIVDVLMGRRPRGRRLYIVMLPMLLFAIWWAGWGHDAESHLSGENLTDVFGWVFDAAAAGIVSLLGLATDDGTSPDQPHLIWGQILVPIVALAVGLRVYRDRGLSKGLAVALVLALAFWILAGLNRSPERFPTSSRYQFPSAVFLLLVGAEALRGIRLPKLVPAVAAAVVLAASISGISLMEAEHEERWEPAANSIRSSLAAINLAGGGADPAFPVSIPPSIVFSTGTYLDATAEHGSPAFDEAELAARPEPERAAADLTMAQAMGLALLPPPEGERVQCRTVPPSSAGEPGQTLPPGDYEIANTGSAPWEAMLGRFADGYSVGLGSVDAGVTTSLSLPDDAAERPWRLGLVGTGSARLCVIR
jgi:hypothetical protein